MGKEDSLIGCKATFRLKNSSGDLSGEIQNIDTENKMITFYKVSVEEVGKSLRVLTGLQNYYLKEIKDLEITGEVNHTLKRASLGKPFERNSMKPKKEEKSLRHNKDTPEHLDRLLEFDPASMYMMTLVEAEIEKTKTEDGQYESKLPPNSTLLDDCHSQLFKNAIAHLKECPTIGMSFEGVKLGREGQLSWIVVSTVEHTMYFDVKTMGKDSFDAGLRDLLQNPDVMKVIHDCRRSSDILHHQYNTKLVNIFDTQVGAVYIHKLMNKNDFPRYVTSLADCLRNELTITNDDIHFPVLRDINPENDEEVWNVRPAPNLVYEWMHKHCRYLLPLRDRQLELMLMEFTMGVDIFLKNLRDANKPDAAMRMGLQHLLPMEFSGLPMMARARLNDQKRRKKKVPLKYISSATKDKQGWVENCTGIANPFMVGSHDTIWHASNPSWKYISSDRRKEQEPAKHRPGSGAREGNRQESKQDVTTNGGVDPCQSSGPANESSTRPSPQASPDTTRLSPVDAGDSSSRPTPQVTSDTTRISPVTDGDSGTRPILQPPPDTSRVSPVAAGHSQPANPDAAQLTKNDLVASLLSQATREQQERERNGQSNAINYIFRPAGEIVQGVSKKKRGVAAQSFNNTGDLASRTVKPCPVIDMSVENEYDMIPSKSKAIDQTGFHQSLQEPGGFDIMTFKEAVPPPPYAVSDMRGSENNGGALAAILPRVDNQSVLLEGSRASRHSASTPVPGDSSAFSDSGESCHARSQALSRMKHQPVSESGRSVESKCKSKPLLSSHLTEGNCAPLCVPSAGVSTSPPQRAQVVNGLEPHSSSVATSAVNGFVTQSCPRSQTEPQPTSTTTSQTECKSTSNTTSDTRSLPSSQPWPQATSHTSSQTRSQLTSSTVSTCPIPARSSASVSNGSCKSVSEVKEAIQKGQSLMSILGSNLSPQQMLTKALKSKDSRLS